MVVRFGTLLISQITDKEYAFGTLLEYAAELSMLSCNNMLLTTLIEGNPSFSVGYPTWHPGGFWESEFGESEFKFSAPGNPSSSYASSPLAAGNPRQEPGSPLESEFGNPSSDQSLGGIRVCTGELGFESESRMPWFLCSRTNLLSQCLSGPNMHLERVCAFSERYAR